MIPLAVGTSMLLAPHATARTPRLAPPVMGQTTAPYMFAARFSNSAVPTTTPQARRSSGSSSGSGEAAPPSILVHGGSLKTWSYPSPSVEEVQFDLKTEGRPLDASVELWNGPDYIPCKARIYVENGKRMPFSAVFQTPRGPNTLAVRNMGLTEYPFYATVSADLVAQPSVQCAAAAMAVQGGALRTFAFEPSVDSVQVLLTTDGRPLNARVELLQGPNNNKQVIELYSEEGSYRPFFCVLPTPGSGNVVRIVNTAPMEFPMTASVIPHTIRQVEDEAAVVGGGDIVLDDLMDARAEEEAEEEAVEELGPPTSLHTPPRRNVETANGVADEAASSAAAEEEEKWMERAAEEMDAAVREQMAAAATPAGVDGAPSVSSAVEAAVKAVEVVMDAVEAEGCRRTQGGGRGRGGTAARGGDGEGGVDGETCGRASRGGQGASAARGCGEDWRRRSGRSGRRPSARRRRGRRPSGPPRRVSPSGGGGGEGSRSHPAETLRRADARGSEDAAEAEAAEEEVHAETPWEAHRRRRFDSAARERDEALAVLAKRALADSARLRARLEAVDRRSPPTTGRGATALDRGAASRHADSLDSLPSPAGDRSGGRRRGGGGGGGGDGGGEQPSGAASGGEGGGGHAVAHGAVPSGARAGDGW